MREILAPYLVPLLLCSIAANFSFPCLAATNTSDVAEPPAEPLLHPKSRCVPVPAVVSRSDFTNEMVSPDAIALAKQLDLLPSFRQLGLLRHQVQSYDGGKAPIELRVDLTDLRQDIVDKVEQTRMEIEYVQAELHSEIAGNSELVQAYSAYRDHKVNRANLLAFRANGVLWSVAEGLSIPTCRTPNYAIPAGIVGIWAGLVPSIFSAFAVRSSEGGHFDREPRQNMLAPLFEYKITPRLEYPKSVWDFLHSAPAGDPTHKTRTDHLVDRWIEDKNIHYFNDRKSQGQLDELTGTMQNKMSIDLMSDRLNMLQQLSALIDQMNRPLLELMMATRGTKEFPKETAEKI